MDEVNLGLVVDEVLVAEYRRQVGARSDAGHVVLARLLSKSAIVTVVAPSLDAVAPFFGPGSWADAIHAAAALQSGAVLITNDHDFNRVAESGLVDIWSSSRAIREPLQDRRG